MVGQTRNPTPEPGPASGAVGYNPHTYEWSDGGGSPPPQPVAEDTPLPTYLVRVAKPGATSPDTFEIAGVVAVYPNVHTGEPLIIRGMDGLPAYVCSAHLFVDLKPKGAEA